MWKLILVVFLACAVCTPSTTYSCCTPGPKGEQGIPGADGKNGDRGPAGLDAECNRQNTAGAGVDLMLLETKTGKVGVEAQYRFDERNNAHSTYVVLKLNPWKK